MESQENITGQSQREYNQISFIGYNYGQPILDLSGYDKVIMCDVSFPKDIMYLEANCSNRKLIWIDHHVSAINDSKIDKFYQYDKTEGLRNTKFAACELTWKYFFPDKEMPEIVRLLGRYDCFGHKGTNEEQKVLEFQYGARNYITNYKDAYKYLQMYFDREINKDENNELINSIWTIGSNIYSYLCTEAKQVYKNGFPIRFVIPHPEYIGEGQYKIVKFICINKERFNPINFGINYHKDEYDGAACFYFDGNTYNFSLYNDNGEVDCSQIAKQYGGGGHRGAAGFRIKDLSEIL